MSRFYIEYPDPNNSNALKVLSLSSTTSIKISEPANVTSYPVEDGSSVVDNYVVDNRVVTFDGIITNVSITSLAGDQLPTDDWIAEMRNIRSRKQLVTVHVSGVDLVPNCVVTNFQLNKTKSEGITGWKCSLSMKEVDISERIRVVSVKKPIKEVEDEVAAKQKVAGSSTKEVNLATSSALDITNQLNDLL